MTEAMSRRDIEDVLTSIKRLVSQDAQTRTAAEAPAQRPEKLVLTPALRVMPEQEEAPTPALAEVAPEITDAPEIPALEKTDAAANFSLIRRISQAGIVPSEVPAAAPEPEKSDRFSDDTVEMVMDSLEDSALEATLARLEAVLSGKPVSPTDAPNADNADSANDGEQIIDEGMLYQLVAHIVRQELQGELGEKITRNIRKLVRQEVAREMQLRQS